jgi:hypothetical protein
MDVAGNALVVWSTELRHRRYIHGLGWQPAASVVGLGVDPDYIWAAAAPDGTVLAIADEFGLPLALRFQ